MNFLHDLSNTIVSSVKKNVRNRVDKEIHRRREVFQPTMGQRGKIDAYSVSK